MYLKSYYYLAANELFVPTLPPLETATLQSHTKLGLLGAAVFNGKY